jgi:hypothetical protein
VAGLRDLMYRCYGRNRGRTHWKFSTRERLEASGHYRMRGTNRRPRTRVVTATRIIGRPCPGKPRARIESGMMRARQERAPLL